MYGQALPEGERLHYGVLSRPQIRCTRQQSRNFAQTRKLSSMEPNSLLLIVPARKNMSRMTTVQKGFGNRSLSEAFTGQEGGQAHFSRTTNGESHLGDHVSFLVLREK